MKVLTALMQTVILASASMATLPQSSAVRTSPVAVGESAPEFVLEDQNGHHITLSSARGKAPVVLVFYRGYW